MQHKNANVTIRLQEDISTLARASKEDSEVIRNIAIENKKDGASMKTIAILGMIFLPGTFLAVWSSLATDKIEIANFSQTVFGMPVFNWEENGELIIKPGFKYYCIATVASTVFVLLLWALSMAFRSSSRAKGMGSKAQKKGADNVWEVGWGSNRLV